MSVKEIFGELLATSNKELGLTVPIPTSPVSRTVTTCVEPSYNRTKSPDPFCVTATPTIAPEVKTSILSTSIKFVSNVVVVPFTVKSPPRTKLPLISPFPFTSNPVAVTIPVTLIPSLLIVVPPPIVIPSKGPTNLVAVIIPLEFIL